MVDLPVFAYHPDPVATGAVAASPVVCACCGRERSHAYVGPVYAVDAYHGRLCPWCVADGSAHPRLDATFTDEEGIGGGGAWESVPEAVVREVATRTPGFSGWQQERWWTHCGDAGVFLGPFGRAEVLTLGEDAVEEDAGIAARSGATRTARSASALPLFLTQARHRSKTPAHPGGRPAPRDWDDAWDTPSKWPTGYRPRWACRTRSARCSTGSRPTASSCPAGPIPATASA